MVQRLRTPKVTKLLHKTILISEQYFVCMSTALQIFFLSFFSSLSLHPSPLSPSIFLFLLPYPHFVAPLQPQSRHYSSLSGALRASPLLSHAHSSPTSSESTWLDSVAADPPRWELCLLRVCSCFRSTRLSLSYVSFVFNPLLKTIHKISQFKATLCTNLNKRIVQKA